MNRREFVMAWRQAFATNPEVKGRCFYCGRVMHVRSRRHDPFLQTEEHIVSQWRNSKAQFNRVAACLACNSGKCGADIQNFREWYGKPFFCEEVLGAELPTDYSDAGDGKYRLHYDDLLDNFTRNAMRRIAEQFHNNSRLQRAINNCIREAQSCLK